MTNAELEKLLADRAFGALAPEVNALLDNHLAQNPRAAQQAAEFTSTVRLAQLALALPCEIPRPLDLGRMRQGPRTNVGRRHHWEIMRLAACVTVGLTIGWLARPKLSHPADVPRSIQVSRSSRPAQAAEPPTRFWSLAHLAPNTPQFPPQKKP